MRTKVVRGAQDPDLLTLSFDRKVSPAGFLRTYKGREFWNATSPNSFGLPAGLSCPGRTLFCESCYAERAEGRPVVAAAMLRNLRLLQEAKTAEGMAALLGEAIDRFHRHATAANEPKLFRIHWDGDFFSAEYAEAWARVIRAHPDVDFWSYTRSFREPLNVVPILAGVENLALYLSVDEENAADAADVLAAFDVLAAPCAKDVRAARALPGGEDAVWCPENAGRMPLMDESGGACVTCRLCPDGRRNVIFTTSHRLDVSLGVPVPLPGLNGVECAAKDCEVKFGRSAGPGRPRKFCSRACQVRAWRSN